MWTTPAYHRQQRILRLYLTDQIQTDFIQSVDLHFIPFGGNAQLDGSSLALIDRGGDGEREHIL